MEIIQHVLKTVMGVMDNEQIRAFSHWMSYRGFYNFTDICDHLYHISEDIYNYAEYRVNGIKYQLKFNTMYKIEVFIKWMSERMKNDSFTLHEFLTPLTGDQFFRQEDMKLLSNSRSSHIGPQKPMTTITGHTKSSATSESQTVLSNFKRGTKKDASGLSHLQE